MKKPPLLALFSIAVLLLVSGFAVSNVALRSGEYRRALVDGFILAIAADCVFAYVFHKGSRSWRIAAAVGALPSLYVFYDFATRGF